MRGRYPAGPEYVDRLAASQQAKQRTKLILQTVFGGSRVADVCTALDICPQRFQQFGGVQWPADSVPCAGLIESKGKHGLCGQALARATQAESCWRNVAQRPPGVGRGGMFHASLASVRASPSSRWLAEGGSRRPVASVSAMRCSHASNSGAGRSLSRWRSRRMS